MEKTHPQADMAVLFLHNEGKVGVAFVGVAYAVLAGYSTMCGHACIALGRYALDYKLVKPVSPETCVHIQCPCGLVTVYVQYDAETGQSGSVRFESVPSYAFAVDQTIQVGKSESTCTCTCTCMCTYMYMHVYVHVHACVRTCTCMCMYMC